MSRAGHSLDFNGSLIKRIVRFREGNGRPFFVFSNDGLSVTKICFKNIMIDS